MTDSAHTARSAIQRLLRGEAPNGIVPDDCGPWASVVQALADAYDAGGTPAVRSTFSALARAHQDLAALIAADVPASTSAPRALTPALPAAATAIYAHAAPCAQWLDDYIAFASQAAPMRPLSFHQAAGLVAVSVAIARRLVVRMSLFSFYPNLFILWIGAPGTYHKSTGFAILQELTKAAGLRKHLLPKRITPEALLHEMSPYLPDDFETRTPAAQQAFLAGRAVAAQRAWLIDEASFLFSSMKRDYNAPLGEMLLEMWDCPDELCDQTISRGAQAVRGIYLTLFGATTPKNAEQRGGIASADPRYAPLATFRGLSYQDGIQWCYSCCYTMLHLLRLGVQGMATADFPVPSAACVAIADQHGVGDGTMTTIVTTDRQTYLRAVHDAALAELAATDAGRNTTLFRVAVRLYQFCAAGYWSEETITHQLTLTATALGLPHTEIRATLRSAYRRAATHPVDLMVSPREADDATCSSEMEVQHLPPAPCEPSSEAWQARAEQVLEAAQRALWATQDERAQRALAWLHDVRELSYATIVRGSGVCPD